MQAIQDLFDTLVTRYGGSKTDAAYAVRSAFPEADLPASLPVATSRDPYDVWTPEAPHHVARHLFPALAAEYT